MKFNKLSKLLSSAMSLTATIGVIVPLASCSQHKSVDTKIKIIDESKKVQSIESNATATVSFELDKEGYNPTDIAVKALGDNTDDLILSYDISGKILTLQISCPHPQQDSYQYTFKLEFIHKDWNIQFDGFKLKVNRTSELKTVYKINSLIKDNKQSTMSGLISFLKENNIDLPSLITDVSTDQWVWDSQNNVVFVLTKDETIRTAPKNYVLNQNKPYIWKMVNVKTTSSKLVQIDSFSSTTLYSQYLRAGQTLPSRSIKVCSGIDTTAYDNLELSYEKPTNSNANIPTTINSNNSSLEVKSTTADLNHYGSLNNLTITSMAINSCYHEFGSIDAKVSLNFGSIIVEDNAKINDLIIGSNDAIGVKVNTYGILGAVTKLTEVTKEINEFVDDSAAKEKPLVHSLTTRYYCGVGSITSPYVIADKQHLLNCQDDVNANGKTSSCFILLNDIDMEGVTTFSGIGTKEKPFRGKFDGKNHTVSNLNLLSDIAVEKLYGKGFFNYVVGQYNSNMPTKTNVWNNDTKEVDYKNVVNEKSYHTVVKNLKLLNFTNIVTGEWYHNAGIVGFAELSYISNCHVLSGTISGHKGVGGVVGCNNGSAIVGCTTGAELLVKTDIYNCAGIVGNDNREWISTESNKHACVVISHCINNAHVVAEVKDQNKSVGGSVAGIIALAQGAEAEYGDVIDNCQNNGLIESYAAEGSTTQCCPNPAGIIGNGLGIYVCANSTNNGEVKTKDTSECYYASGIANLCAPIMINCHNNKTVSAKADFLAGVISHAMSNLFEKRYFEDITNTGTLTNYNTLGITSPLISQKESSKELTFKNLHFDNVEQLNQQIKSTQALSIALIDVIVDNTDGTLNLDPSLISITSNKKICSNVALNAANTSITINLPETNITIEGSYPLTAINNYGYHSNVYVKQGSAVKSVKIAGENSEIVNDGTIVDAISLSNRCTKGTNSKTGTIGKLSFDNSEIDGLAGFDHKVFDNYGSIIASSTSTSHTISTISKSAYLTLNNYGIIKHEPTDYYALLFYNDSSLTPSTGKTNTINNFGEAQFWYNSARFCATHNTVYVNYNSTAKLYKDSVEVEWTTIQAGHVVVKEI